MEYTEQEMIDKLADVKAATIAYLELPTTQKQCGSPKGIWTDDSKCVCDTHCPYCAACSVLQVIDNQFMSVKEKMRSLHLPVIKEIE